MSDVCELNLRKAVGNNDDLFEVLADVEMEAERLAELHPERTKSDFMMEMLEELADEEALLAARTEIAVAKSLEAQQALVRSYEGFKNDAKFKPRKALVEAIVTAGNDVSAYTQTKQAAFVKGLEDAGVDEFFIKMNKNRDDALAFLTEIGELNKRRGQPGITGSESARKAAKIFQDLIDDDMKQQKQLGIRADTLEGRMLRQSWWPESLIRYGSSEKFADDMVHRIDRKRTFKKDNVSDAEVKKFLTEFYNERIKGLDDEVALTSKHLTAQKPTFAQMQLNRRQIHLKSAEDSLFVLENFGEGNIVGAMYQAVGRSALRTRIASLFGANPRHTVDVLATRAMKDMTPAEALKVRTRTGRGAFSGSNIDTLMDIIDGSMDITASSPNIKLGAHTVQNIMRFSLLQQVLVASIPDFATVNAAASRVGGSVAKDVSARMKQVFRNLDDKQKQLLASSAQTAIDFQISAIAQQVAPNSRLGKITNATTGLSAKTMVYGGINRWTRWQKGTATILWSGILSRSLGDEWTALDQGVKNQLLRGGVGAEEWAQLKNIPDAVYKERGLEMLDIDTIRASNKELAARLQASLNDFADSAVPTPGVRERAIMTQGQDGGTLYGAAFRFTTALLGYPITAITRSAMRDWEMGRTKGIMLTSKFAALSMFYGYAAVVASDLAKGRTREYTSDDLAIQGALFQEALIRSGFGGILSSVVIDAMRFGSPASSILSGAPAAVIDRTTNDLIYSGKYLSQGDTDKAIASAARTIRNLTPFASLPYTKPIVDAFIYHPVLEMTDPSRLNRIERDWERKTGGEYFTID